MNSMAGVAEERNDTTISRTTSTTIYCFARVVIVNLTNRVIVYVFGNFLKVQSFIGLHRVTSKN